MNLLFFIIGILTAVVVSAAIKLNKTYKITLPVWLLGGFGFFLFLFAIAWSASSVIEAEPRAASMGMIFFGIPSVILLALGLRLAKKQKLRN